MEKLCCKRSQEDQLSNDSMSTKHPVQGKREWERRMNLLEGVKFFVRMVNWSKIR